MVVTSGFSGGDQALRVLRGGAWDGSPRGLRSASRIRGAPVIRYSGPDMRIARTL